MSDNPYRQLGAIASIALGLVFAGSYLFLEDVFVAALGVVTLLIGVGAWVGNRSG